MYNYFNEYGVGGGIFKNMINVTGLFEKNIARAGYMELILKLYRALNKAWFKTLARILVGSMLKIKEGI